MQKNLYGPDLDKQYYFGCIYVFPTKPLQQLRSAVAFMYKKPEKMVFFVNFDLFYGISLVLPLNFTDLHSTQYQYFKLCIAIFMKKNYFPMTNKGPNFGLQIRHND